MATQSRDQMIIKTPQTIIGMRCLIVCDHATGRKVLSLHVNHWGGISRETAVVTNAAEKTQTALEANQAFDAVIVDLKDGDIAVYRTIAENIQAAYRKKGLSPCALICLTVKAKRGDAALMKSFGYSVYLTKPLKQSHLFKSLLLIKELYEGAYKLGEVEIITKYFVDQSIPDYYRILFVEEAPTRLKNVVAGVSKLKIRCDMACDGQTAIAAVGRKTYDLILADINLPDMSGDEFAQQLRQQEKAYPGLPIIGTVENITEDVKNKCQVAGITDLITKPITGDDLTNVLKKYLK